MTPIGKTKISSPTPQQEQADRVLAGALPEALRASHCADCGRENSRAPAAPPQVTDYVADTTAAITMLNEANRQTGYSMNPDGMILHRATRRLRDELTAYLTGGK